MPSMEVSGGEQLDEKKDTGGLEAKSVRLFYLGRHRQDLLIL